VDLGGLDLPFTRAPRRVIMHTKRFEISRKVGTMDKYKIIKRRNGFYIQYSGGTFYFAENASGKGSTTKNRETRQRAEFWLGKLETAYRYGRAEGFEEAERHFKVGRAKKGLI
jgi:hypothetical protein